MKTSLDQWKELLGHLEVLKTYYARLTDRERYIVLGISTTGIIVVLVVIYSFFAASAMRMNTRIDTSKKDLKELHNMHTEYLEMERQVENLERMISRTSPDFQLATELGRLAQKYAITIDSLVPGRGMPNDLYRESLVTVTVRQINLKVLINFLHDIENAKQLMRITSLKIRPNFQDATALNINFVVSTFQPNQ